MIKSRDKDIQEILDVLLDMFTQLDEEIILLGLQETYTVWEQMRVTATTGYMVAEKELIEKLHLHILFEPVVSNNYPSLQDDKYERYKLTNLGLFLISLREFYLDKIEEIESKNRKELNDFKYLKDILTHHIGKGLGINYPDPNSKS